MVYHRHLVALHHVEVVGYGVPFSLFLRQVFIELKARLVQLDYHLLFFPRYIVGMEKIPHIYHFLLCDPTKFLNVVGGIQEVLLQIIYHIHHLISVSRECLYRLQHWLQLLIVALGYVIYRIGRDKVLIDVRFHRV